MKFVIPQGKVHLITANNIVYYIFNMDFTLFTFVKTIIVYFFELKQKQLHLDTILYNDEIFLSNIIEFLILLLSVTV